MAEQDIALRNASVVRQEFGGTELSLQNEVASSAIAAQMQALVAARYQMAVRYRRDWDMVRDRLLKECHRPGFAKAAIYHKPIGGGIEGLSIRFAEAAIRCMTNVAPEVFTVYDDTEKRVVRVSVTDIEANVPYSRDIVIDKTVERKSLKENQTPIRVRQNSEGKLTYLVPATEDEILNKENALVSKALRTLALRVLPGDIKDECEVILRKIRKDSAAKDPDADKKQLLDAFSLIGVKPEMISEFLDHTLDSILPAELVELRAVYQGIKEGEATWKDVMALRIEQRGGSAKPTEKADPPTAGTQKLKDRIDRQRKKETSKSAAAPAPTPINTIAPASPPAPAAAAAEAPAEKSQAEIDQEQMDREQARALEAEAAAEQGGDGWGDE